MTIGKMGADFDFASLNLSLKGTTAEVLLPSDGEKYEKSIERWSEHCIKRAVSVLSFLLRFLGSKLHAYYYISTIESSVSYQASHVFQDIPSIV
jgi:hypothetical protein